jgi:hypothetical protein
VVLVLVGLLGAFASGAAPVEKTDPGLFESASPVRAEDELEPLIVFDQAAVPSDYETCYWETKQHAHLKILRPYDMASFPRNIAPPKFRWEDLSCNRWRMTLTVPGLEGLIQTVTDRPEWRPDMATWERIKESAEGQLVRLEVRGCLVRDGRRVGDVYVDSVRFKISEHPIDPVIVYRLVSPMFHGLKTPHIYYRDTRNFETRLFLPSEGVYCTNCHAFPTNPDLPEKDISLAIAVRGGGVRRLGIYNFATREGRQLPLNSFFMCWNTEGNKIAVTGGKDIYSRPMITLETQEFYVFDADVQIVNLQTGAFAPLPGASSPEYMECFPSWSPDGKTIAFCRALEFEIGPQLLQRQAKYDLFTIPYNDGNGGTAVPVPGAHQNGLSNFAPRYSPDGKWMVFCKGKFATLVKPGADLWIISTEEGATPRELECNTHRAMDSHHSWSSNSRWLMFSTKRDDGIFARPYLTEIDESGHASPPVALPTLGETMLCFNVPEFLRYKPDIDGWDVVAKTSHVKPGLP